MVAVAIVPLMHLIGDRVTFPDEEVGTAPAGGAINTVVLQLSGKANTTDFLIDYSSTRALVGGRDAYAPSADLNAAVGVPWEVANANPHPPSTLTLVLPLAALSYRWAVSVWAMTMTVLIILTLRLCGLELGWAILGGTGIVLTFPGADGIANPVPIIGFGVALAYRYRHSPWLAGAGIAIAAAPKFSGALLLLPFIVAGRVRAVLVGAVAWLGMCAVPLLYDRSVWSNYRRAGLDSARANAARDDNASIVHLGERVGVAPMIVVIGLLIVAAALAWRRRDLFWPATWLVVASLPIAWMYSTLTLVPIVVAVVPLRARSALIAATSAAILVLGCAPFGRWPVVIFPIVVALVWCALWLAPRSPDGVWFHPHLGRRGGFGDLRRSRLLPTPSSSMLHTTDR